MLKNIFPKIFQAKQTKNKLRNKKNIFCHYRSDNKTVWENFNKFSEKTKWQLDWKWLVTRKNEHQIRAQVKRFQIDVSILFIFT